MKASALPVLDSLTKLLDGSSRPIYAVDRQRRIVYCNAALADWLELNADRIIGRFVEYHSEPDGENAAASDAGMLLADLCPPPRALAGEACIGTISCVARGGRLVHRRGEFVPLGSLDDDERPGNSPRGGLLAILSASDLSPQEVASHVSSEPSADELHRAIRRFRREQSNRYAVESLLGESSTMRKVRDQVAAAAASGANALVYGEPGTGRSHVARAIHYRAAGEMPLKLVPIDCEFATEDQLRRALDSLGGPNADARNRPTLLLENLERLATSHQSQLAAAIRRHALPARIIGTVGPPSRGGPEESDRDDDVAPTRNPAKPAAACPSGHLPAGDTERMTLAIEPTLLDAVSTLTIRAPRLVERMEDLPILAQCFLEACNRGSGKQVGSFRPDVLDLLALYSWPGELDELRETIAAAHRACTSHEITPADLPAVVHHASHAAARIRRQPQRIVLDELLATIEREAIVRALAQAGGNKSEAAELLGMTRPRLYRRLVQLGLAGEAPLETEAQAPGFIERAPNDNEP